MDEYNSILNMSKDSHSLYKCTSKYLKKIILLIILPFFLPPPPPPAP